MKSFTVRLPESLVADIEAESRGRKISKSDVVREWLERAPRQRRRTASLTAIADLIGSVDGLPSDLTARKKEYLHAKGYAPETSSLTLDLLWRCLVQSRRSPPMGRDASL